MHYGTWKGIYVTGKLWSFSDVWKCSKAVPLWIHWLSVPGILSTLQRRYKSYLCVCVSCRMMPQVQGLPGKAEEPKLHSCQKQRLSCRVAWHTCNSSAVKWRQKDGWSLLAASLAPGSVRDPTSKECTWKDFKYPKSAVPYWCHIQGLFWPGIV